ncbi:MAG: hypothetical protein JST26_20880 [Bacteroidetes bacterium]|nr:hypothetical protein [Bacteroidota bacterium]
MTPKNILQIIEDFNTLMEGFTNAQDLANFITGGSSDSTNSILAAIETELEVGFTNVINAINASQDLDNWNTNFQPTFDRLATYISTYSNTLSTLTPVDSTLFPSGFSIIAPDGSPTDFELWALLGSNNIITINGTQFVTLPMVDLYESISPQNGTSLYNLFIDVPFGHTIFDVYYALLNDAAQDSGNQQLAVFNGSTKLENLDLLRNVVYNLLISIVFLYEAIRTLLSLINNSNNSQYSLKETIQKKYGNYQTPGTVWGCFGEQYTNLLNNPILPLSGGVIEIDPIAQINTSAVTQDNWTKITNSDSDDCCYMPNVYFAGSFSTMSDANIIYPNQPSGSVGSYIVALRFTQITSQVSPSQNVQVNPGGYLLQCQVASITKDSKGNISYQVDTNWYPSPNDPLVQDGWQVSYIGALQVYSYTNSAVLLNDSSGNPPSDNTMAFIPPVQTSVADGINVATGIQLQMVGNRMAIALQYGVLNMSMPLTPSIQINDPTFYAPAWFSDKDQTDYYTWKKLPDYLDLRPSGEFSIMNNGVPATLPSFITNVALSTAQRGCLPPIDPSDGNMAYGNRLYIITQFAPCFYQLSCNQPYNLY